LQQHLQQYPILKCKYTVIYFYICIFHFFGQIFKLQGLFLVKRGQAEDLDNLVTALLNTLHHFDVATISSSEASVSFVACVFFCCGSHIHYVLCFVLLFLFLILVLDCFLVSLEEHVLLVKPIQVRHENSPIPSFFFIFILIFFCSVLCCAVLFCSVLFCFVICFILLFFVFVVCFCLFLFVLFLFLSYFSCCNTFIFFSFSFSSSISFLFLLLFLFSF
jgi:hypothetical protein